MGRFFNPGIVHLKKMERSVLQACRECIQGPHNPSRSFNKGVQPAKSKGGAQCFYPAEFMIEDVCLLVQPVCNKLHLDAMIHLILLAGRLCRQRAEKCVYPSVDIDLLQPAFTGTDQVWHKALRSYGLQSIDSLIYDKGKFFHAVAFLEFNTNIGTKTYECV